MCGRFAFYSPSEATAALFGVNDALPVEARYNIAPTQYVAAIRNDGETGRQLLMLRWGLVPFWAKDPSIGNRMINARAETVAEKPSFRAAYKQRRSLILADGFYEWRKEGDGKTPYFISKASAEPLAFAGLWESWHNKETGETLQSTTIVTTAANDFMQQLHLRMPVIVEPELADAWLQCDERALPAAIEAMPRMQAWPVSRAVNNARNEGEQLLSPAGESLRQE
ncbi:MAG: SOS response-associated peptidase [Woeseia sp.]